TRTPRVGSDGSPRGHPWWMVVWHTPLRSAVACSTAPVPWTRLRTERNPTFWSDTWRLWPVPTMSGERVPTGPPNGWRGAFRNRTCPQPSPVYCVRGSSFSVCPRPQGCRTPRRTTAENEPDPLVLTEQVDNGEGALRNHTDMNPAERPS